MIENVDSTILTRTRPIDDKEPLPKFRYVRRATAYTYLSSGDAVSGGYDLVLQQLHSFWDGLFWVDIPTVDNEQFE